MCISSLKGSRVKSAWGFVGASGFFSPPSVYYIFCILFLCWNPQQKSAVVYEHCHLFRTTINWATFTCKVSHKYPKVEGSLLPKCSVFPDYFSPLQCLTWTRLLLLSSLAHQDLRVGESGLGTVEAPRHTWDAGSAWGVWGGWPGAALCGSHTVSWPHTLLCVKVCADPWEPRENWI